MGYDQTVIIMAENADDKMDLQSVLFHIDWARAYRRCNCLKKGDALIYIYERINPYNLSNLLDISLYFPGVRFTLYELPDEFDLPAVKRIFSGEVQDEYQLWKEQDSIILHFHPEVFYLWFQQGGIEEGRRESFLRQLSYDVHLPEQDGKEFYSEFAQGPMPFNMEDGYRLRARCMENPAFYGWERQVIQTDYTSDAALLEKLIQIRLIEFQGNLTDSLDRGFPNPTSLVRFYRAQNKLDKAVEIFKLALTCCDTYKDGKYADHEASWVSVEFAEFYRQQNQFGQAIELLKQSLAKFEELAPNSYYLEKILLELALLYCHTEQFGEIEALYLRGLKYFESYPSKYSNDVDFLLKFADMLVGHKQFDQASKLYLQSKALCLQSTYRRADTQLFEVKIKLADLYQLQGKSTDAIAIYQELLALEIAKNGRDPEAFQVMNLNAKILVAQGRPELAKLLLMPARRTGIQGIDTNVLKNIAEDGNADAQFLMGHQSDYLHGKIGLEDNMPPVSWENFRDRVIFWYSKAAEQGQPAAQAKMGDAYRLGLGVLQDYKIALTWYLKSAAQGYKQAYLILGMMYKNGLGVVVDHEKAKEHLEKWSPNAVKSYYGKYFSDITDEVRPDREYVDALADALMVKTNVNLNQTWR